MHIKSTENTWKIGFSVLLAEWEGFEPSRGFWPPTPLAGEIKDSKTYWKCNVQLWNDMNYSLKCCGNEMWVSTVCNNCASLTWLHDIIRLKNAWNVCVLPRWIITDFAACVNRDFNLEYENGVHSRYYWVFGESVREGRELTAWMALSTFSWIYFWVVA